MKCLHLILLHLVVLVVCQNDNPKVSTPLGDILGSLLTSRLNKTIYAFRGIRYAQPPIGNLRFKPPVPVQNWSGVYNATVDGSVCPQPSDDPVSEDCLLLNVYTTQLPQGTNNPKRPVIFFIHAGGYYSGTGRSDWGGPQYFLDQDIVLVTINYRLATLGFISTGEDAPGNNGLKDQVLALKWVRDNIECFGGDPGSVTLFGYSAGGFSISLHMVSPMSRGLFHRAILGSGSALGQEHWPNNQLELAQQQARLVGCPDNVTASIMLECLRSIPAEVLGNTLDDFFIFNYDPILIWYPVIEEDFGQERFLSEDPLKMIQRGDFAKIPIIAGVTEVEFGYKAFDVLGNQTLLDQFNNNYETLAPICFLYERDSPKSKEISAAIKTFYFDDEPVSNASFDGLAHAYADSVIGFAVNRLVNLISEKNPGQVYYYEFTYRGRYSHYVNPDTNTTFGAVHHDDLIYLFYIAPLFPFFDESYPESEMVEKLTMLWATFAETGQPIPESSPLFEGITWEPFNASNKNYLDIGNEIVLKKELYQDRYDFWSQLFEFQLEKNKQNHKTCKY